MKNSVLTFSTLAILSTASYADTPSHSLSIDNALKVAMSAMQSCNDKKFNCAITVVDEKGKPKSQIIMDGATPFEIESSISKAETAATGRILSHIFKDLLNAIAGFALPFNINPSATQRGGVSIIVDNKTIGGIGVSGVPGSDKNGIKHETAIATKAIQSIMQ